MIGIYKITKIENGKSYIGQSNDIERRFKEHKNKIDIPVEIAIQKYGAVAFKFEIIEECSLEQLDEREIYWIAFYDTFNNDKKGYNMTPGGGNYMKELWKDQEFRNKMCYAFSLARKRDWSNEEFAQNRLNSLLDGLNKAWEDPIWRENRIKNMMGDKNSNAKSVKNLETNKIFTTIKEAAKWAGLKSVSGIGQCCRGKQKTAGHHPETNEPLHWVFC